MIETEPRRTQRELDAELKVSGQIPYALNINLPGMVHARCVRSPYAHARILRVDASRAMALKGVVTVLTRDDLTDGQLFSYYGAAVKDQPIVAIDKARHVGDIVAAVVAEDIDTAAEAAALVDVEYEELPAVFDAVEALQPGAPLVHEQVVGVYELPPSAGIRPVNGTNLINHMKVRRGDVDRGFDQADVTFEEVYSSPALYHCPLEPHVTVAEWTDDLLSIWSATQMPYFVRQQVADVFRVPPERVRVFVDTCGGGFGAKTYARMEPLTAVLAWKARRPVKLVLTRAEEFVTTTKHEARVRIKSGVRQDGTLLAREVEVHYNGGAYADRSGTIARSGGIGATGPYEIPNVKVDAYAVYTNRPNAVPFRGLAVSQVAWAYESHTDELARHIGMDPLAFRNKNVLRDGRPFATSELMEDVHFEELLEDAARAIDIEGPPPAPSAPNKLVGRGLAVIIKHMGSNPATTKLEIRWTADGSVNVLSSTVDLGQGSRTVLAREAARALGIPEDRVRVPFVDTGETPPDQGTSSSRSTFFNALAAKAAAQDLYRQVRGLAAQVCELDPERFDVSAGRVSLIPAPGEPAVFAQPAAVPNIAAGIDVTELLRAAGVSSVTGEGGFRTEIGVDEEGQGKASHHWHQAAAGAIVEVDRDTGKVELRRLHLAAHAGRVIDRASAELQNEGCAAFGLSQALFEEMVFDDGRVVNPNLSDYNIASMLDFPVSFTTTLAENRDPDAEVHGLGETGLPAVPPAIGNAVRDAIGKRVARIPLTPERVLSVMAGDTQ